MAIYNEIQVGRLNRFLQKYLGIKGGPPAPQLASDISCALGLFSGVENRVLESWFRYGSAFSQAGVAAQFTNCRLRNPAASNVVAVVESIIVSTGAAADNFALEFNTTGVITTDLATVQTVQVMDGRIKSQKSACIVSSGNNNSTGNGIMTAAMGANTPIQFILFDDQEIVVTPGTVIQVDDGVANQAIRMSIIWRERAMEESEINI